MASILYFQALGHINKLANDFVVFLIRMLPRNTAEDAEWRSSQYTLAEFLSIQMKDRHICNSQTVQQMF